MELTTKQQQGLKIALERYANHEPYTTIAGFAGTGKSTLVKFIVSALADKYNLDPEFDFGYMSFTGKAAQVLIDKGNKNAKTAHKLLYNTKPKSDGTFMHIPKAKGEIEEKIIICDECSMLPRKLMELLLSHNIYVIFCGDPGQLPPISKDDDNHLLDHPHIFLDEIMRQAADSGIIQLSMKIRNGESIDNFKSDDAIVVPTTQLVTGMYDWADIVLCATNATRNNVNRQVRQLKGYTEPIVNGEKLINLKNDWDVLSSNGNALTNGVIGTVNNIFPNFFKYPKYLQVPGNTVPLITGDFISETGDDFGILDMDKQCILTGAPYLDNKLKYKISKNKMCHNLVPLELTYGYCITTWKAQGSEWNKVLGIEEGHPRDREEHKKYLYTLVTRASEKVVLVRK